MNYYGFTSVLLISEIWEHVTEFVSGMSVEMDFSFLFYTYAREGLIMIIKQGANGVLLA